MTAVQPTARIAATGRFLPDRVLTNKDLEQMVDTTEEWILERTGIVERRIAPAEMGVTEMGARAAQRALAKAGIEARDIDLLIVTTATPDRWLPSTSCEIQARIGAIGKSAAFDLHAACTGFLYALTMAEGHVAGGRADTVLVVAAEKMTSIVDWDDRSTCILFGDGAGAAIVQRSENGEGILASHHRSDGNFAGLLERPAGGAANPLDAEALRAKDHMIKMSGREIFKLAVRRMAGAGKQVLRDAGLKGEDVDLLVPHQANARIIESTARYSRIPMEKVFVNLNRYGNMSSASIPVALDEAVEQGLVGPGSVVLTAAFGAGLTWGATAIRW